MITRDPATGYRSSGDVYFDVTNTPLATEVTVQKQWVGNDGEEVTVRLKGTCGSYTITR